MKKKIKFGVFIIYCFVLLILTLHHEPWFDEAQSWLISQKFKFSILQSEGHPCVWYFVESFFIKFGLTYNFSWVIPYSITVITSFIFIFFVRMDKKIKFLFLISPTIFYFSNCFVRVYCLIALLIMILILIYPLRLKHPFVYGILLLLLINTHVVACGLVGALMLFDLYELIKFKKKKLLISLGFSILGIVLLFLQLYKCFIANPDVLATPEDNYLIRFFLNFYNMLKAQTINMWFVSIIFILLGVFCIKMIKYKENRTLFVLLFALLFQLVIYTFVYDFSDYMSVIFFMNFLFCISLIKNIKMFKWNIILIFATTLYGTLHYVSFDYKYNYADCKNTYSFIEDKIPKNSEIYCYNRALCTALKPYDINDNYKFIDYQTDELIDYIEHHQKQYSCKSINNDYNKSIKYYIDGLGYEDIVSKCYNTSDYIILYESDYYKNYTDRYRIMKKIFVNED